MLYNLIGLGMCESLPTGCGCYCTDYCEIVVAQFGSLSGLLNYVSAYPRQDYGYPSGSVLEGYNSFKIQQVGNTFPIDPT